jgi:hypothetical protein
VLAGRPVPGRAAPSADPPGEGSERESGPVLAALAGGRTRRSCPGLAAAGAVTTSDAADGPADDADDPDETEDRFNRESIRRHTLI